MPTTLSRSVLTVLIPGIVAVAPWLLALVQHTKATLGLTTYPSLGNALLFAAAAVAGTIFEGLGSHLEVRWDTELEESFEVEKNWFSYLTRTFDHEPVGYRYLSRLATTLYFELSMLFATPIFIAGVALLAILRFRHLTVYVGVGAPMLMILAGAYFVWQARCTHKLLCKTRRELNGLLAAAAAK